jgi:hypothetical protein
MLMISPLTFLIYMSARNDWVYKERTKMEDEGVNINLTLPTYNYMLWKRWWIWNINKFLSMKE